MVMEGRRKRRQWEWALGSCCWKGGVVECCEEGRKWRRKEKEKEKIGRSAGCWPVRVNGGGKMGGKENGGRPKGVFFGEKREE